MMYTSKFVENVQGKFNVIIIIIIMVYFTLLFLAQIVKSSDIGGSGNEFQRRRIKLSWPYLRQYPGQSVISSGVPRNFVRGEFNKFS